MLVRVGTLWPAFILLLAVESSHAAGVTGEVVFSSYNNQPEGTLVRAPGQRAMRRCDSSKHAGFRGWWCRGTCFGDPVNHSTCESVLRVATYTPFERTWRTPMLWLDVLTILPFWLRLCIAPDCAKMI